MTLNQPINIIHNHKNKYFLTKKHMQYTNIDPKTGNRNQALEQIIRVKKKFLTSKTHLHQATNIGRLKKKKKPQKNNNKERGKKNKNKN